MIKEQKSSPSHNSNFFSVPKLTCLVQNFNIPKPVIHPPGSDPYQFLNPNPQCAEGIKPMDPMDVDPCVVASRFEIVTKTTDLTVSEHAGVTLGEPITTIVSTATSESPIHSEVITQQAVSDVITKTESDVVVTKIESDIAATNIESEVCNVASCSEKAFKQHEEGKLHLKSMVKVPDSSVSKQETSSPVSDNTLEEESDKKNNMLQNEVSVSVIKQEMSPPVVNDSLDTQSEKKNDMLQSETSVNSLIFCSIPALGCDNQKIQKKATEQVIEPLRIDQLLNPTSGSMTTIHHPNGGTQKGRDELNKCLEPCSSGKQHIKYLKNSETIVIPPLITPIISMQMEPVCKPVEDLKSLKNKFGDSILWCEFCKISCTSNDFNNHVSGKKHMKNLKKLATIPNLPYANIPLMTKPMTNSEVCELCGVYCNSCDELKKHKSGKKHQKNLKKFEQLYEQSPVDKTSMPVPSRNDESRVLIFERNKRKDTGSLAIEENGDTKKKQKMMEVEVESGVLLACKVCNLACNGIMAFKYHLASKEHSTMALKQVNAA